jgi:hypothetical protein
MIDDRGGDDCIAPGLPQMPYKALLLLLLLM